MSAYSFTLCRSFSSCLTTLVQKAVPVYISPLEPHLLPFPPDLHHLAPCPPILEPVSHGLQSLATVTSGSLEAIAVFYGRQGTILKSTQCVHAALSHGDLSHLSEAGHNGLTWISSITRTPPLPLPLSNTPFQQLTHGLLHLQ